MADYLKILKQYWGYDDFRGIQEDIITSIGQQRDTLGLMPTGGGKSITFQVPALAQEGLCLVITPLIALMKDQVRNLRDRGIKAIAVYSGMTREEIVVALENCIFGNYKFLYISPERLDTEIFQQKLRSMKVSMITVDESHCISQWGYDFRPAYLKISEIRKLLPGVPVLALTATATPEVVKDIQARLAFKEENVFRMSFERKNLAYVYQLLTHNSEKTLTIMFEKLPPDHPARAPFNLFSQSSDTVKSGIILGLGTRLQVLQNEAVKQLVSFSDIDLTAPGSHKCAYYIILSDQETSMAFLSSLFFSFLFIKLTRFADLSPGGRCPVPVNLILDEFNNIGRIGGAPDGSDFCRSLSVIRSRDIRVMLAVQSLGQLQNRYPNNLWSEIIGNCDIQLMLGCTDDVTADYISDRSGEMCIVVDSTMTVKKTVAVTQVIPQYRETQGQGKRKLLTPDEVLRLPHEQMLVIIRGQNLLLLNKFDYTRHPMSKEMVRASIMDYCPRTSYAPTPQTGSENEPDKKPQRESRGRKLSRSDTPPVEF